MDCICDKFVMVEDGEVFEMSQAAKGDPGPGVAPGGTTGQILAKASDEDYDTEWIDAPDMDAGGVTYDPTEAYDDGTVGKELTTINSALSSLSSVTEIIDTAYGAIASFPDGSGLPMRSLLATIEPEQDLHGQDAPYPAGAGKNKLPLSLANIKTLNTSGTWSGNTYNLNGAFLTVLVDESGNVEGIRTTGQASDEVDFYLYYELLLPAERYTLTGCPSGGSATTYRLFATNIGGDTGSGASGTFDGVKVTTVRINIKSGTNVNGKIFTPMIRLESVTDATFAPYSNVCSVGGWQGLNGEVADINFLNQDGTNTSNGYVNHAYINSFDGAVSQASGTLDVMEYVPVKPNTTYTLSGTSVNISNGWAEYDVNKVQVAHGTASVSPFTFTTGSRTHFVRFNRNYATDTQCQINLGSSALPYVPYVAPLPITCTWQTEAGTVYGGTVDVVTGVLTVTDAIYNPTGSEGGYTQQTGRVAFAVPREYRGGEVVDRPCSDFSIIAGGTAYCYVTTDMTVEELKAYFQQHTVQMLLGLTDTLTYQLTPQQISTLLGNNTVFVDTGSVSVTYQASIKGYIDKVLGA